MKQMMELTDSELAQVVGGEGDDGGGGEAAWTCTFTREGDGSLTLECTGIYGDDMLENAGRCFDTDEIVSCFT